MLFANAGGGEALRGEGAVGRAVEPLAHDLASPPTEPRTREAERRESGDERDGDSLHGACIPIRAPS